MTNTSETPRQRLARLASEEAARRYRRRTIGIGAGVTAALIAVVGAFAVFGNAARTTGPNAGGAGYVQALLHVPSSSLDAVGVGRAHVTSASVDGGAPTLVDGLPRLLYIGAEYCPYCAVERWALVIALSRFGTFSGLRSALSSPDEGALSNIPTVTFAGASYRSDVLTFESVETADRFGKPLASPAPADAALLTRFASGHVPWLYWGTGQQLGASFDGASFMPGVSGDAVAAKLSDPNSVEAQAVLGAANLHTARLCTLTGGKPVDVCGAAGVQAAARELG